MSKDHLAYGTGRRKTSVARVYLRKGKGDITVNEKPVNTYFAEAQITALKSPLQATSTQGEFDIFIRVSGGGVSGQAGACLHGIARALLDVEGSHRATLKAAGYLTRDSRMVERKKYGQKGARKQFQFSKR